MEAFKPERQVFKHGNQEIYQWEQTLEDVSIFVTPPEGTRAKHVTCEISLNHLTLGLKGNPPFLDHDFSHPIKPKESTWTIGIAE